MKRIFLIISLTTILAILVTTNLIIQNKMNMMLIHKMESEDKDVIATAQLPVKDNKLSGESIELYKKYHRNIEDGITGISVNDTYYSNSLVWNRLFYEDEKCAGYYFQIDGLKDKKIQKIVNDKLFKSAINFCDKEHYTDAYYYSGEVYALVDDSAGKERYRKCSIYNGSDENELLPVVHNSDVKKYFEQLVLSSFSNVISVANISLGEGQRAGYFDNNYYEYRMGDRYIDLDLNTGNDLEFESLFASNSNIKSILYHILYSEKAGTWFPIDFYGSDGEDEIKTNEAKAEDYGPDLNDIEKYLKRFENTKDLEFGFTHTQFFVHLDDIFCVQDFENIPSDIGIFKRFLSDNSIYENEDIKYRISLEDKDIYEFNYMIGKDVIVKDKINYNVTIYNGIKEFNNSEARRMIMDYLNDKLSGNSVSNVTIDMDISLYKVDVGIRDDYWEKNISEYDSLFNNNKLYAIVMYDKNKLSSETIYAGIEDDRFFELENPIEYVMNDYSEDKLMAIGKELWNDFYDIHKKWDDITQYNDCMLKKDGISFTYKEHYNWNDSWGDQKMTFYILRCHDFYRKVYPLENKMIFT